MKRKLKALGALLMATALMAVTASAAQADFISSGHHTIITGTQEGNHVISSGEGFGQISCASVTFHGTQTGTTVSVLTLKPTLNICSDSFGRTVDVDDSGLLYHYTTDGTVHVTGNMSWTVTSGGSVVCTVVFKSGQTNNGIGYHNLANGHVTATTKTTNTITTTSGGFFNCGIANGEHKNGTYTGNTTLTGEDTDQRHVAISVNHPTGL